MLVLCVHNKNEVAEVFLAETEENLLEQLVNSKYEYEPREQLDIEERELTLSDFINCYHDGDSCYGFTLFEK